MWNHIRLAARVLLRDRGFTAAAVATLAIGMSATITMFTIVYGVYFRDLPFGHPDRIVTVDTRFAAWPPDSRDQLSLPDLRDLQASATLFDGIAAADEDSMDLADDEHAAERVVGAFVSWNAFRLLGHRPVRGRDFSTADDRDGAPRVVVLGHEIWQRRYGGDESIVGRAVRVNGFDATVIGVMPERFGFPVRSQVWLPLAAMANPNREDRANRNIETFGRMVEGVSVAQAEADLARVMAEIARDFPESHEGISVLVRPFREMTTSGPIRIVFAGLMGAVTLLLLIACANVANLLLAHGVNRSREIAVRVSLGATRGQVLKQLLAESLMIAAFASVAGVLVAAFAIPLFELSIRGTGEPYWLRFPIDFRIFAFAAAVCLATTVLCGLAPSLHTSHVRLSALLSGGGRGASAARRTRRWTDGFVVLQIALSLTMLAAAGLMMRNVTAFARIDIGVDTSKLVRAQMNVSQRYPDVDDRRAFYRRLRERLAQMPGMRAGMASAAPYGGAIPTGIAIDGRSMREGGQASASLVSIDPAYLDALGVRPIRGRTFNEADMEGDRRVAIVNQWFVDAHFKGEEALGRSIEFPADQGAARNEPLIIVGVVGNVRHTSPRQQRADPQAPDPILYVPFSGAAPTIVVRSEAGAAVVAQALRRAIGAIDPNQPIFAVLPMDEALKQELATLRVFTSIFGLFASFAVGLAAVGLYGVTAYAISQRTREVGVRRALGALDRHVWWFVMRRAVVQLVVGVALGLGGALAAGAALQGVLQGVDGRDPVTLVALTTIMAIVAVIACIGPARRALRLDPASLLRAE